MKPATRTIFLALFFVLNVTTPASAQETRRLEEAEAAMARGDSVAALELFRALAEAGNAKAQLRLGLIYRNGQGVELDFVEAATWLRKAAEQGEAEADENLGRMYFFGHGVPQDNMQALQWYDLALTHYPAGDKRRSYVEDERQWVTKILTLERIATALETAGPRPGLGEPNPAALVGLTTVNPGFLLVPGPSGEHQVENEALIERFAENDFGEGLQNLGLGTGEEGPLLACFLKLLETRNERVSWSVRAVLVRSPDPEGDPGAEPTFLWSGEGAGESEADFLESIPIPEVQQACIRQFHQDHQAANPPKHGLELLEQDLVQRVSAAAVYGGRLFLTGGAGNPELRIIEFPEGPEEPTSATEVRIPLEWGASAVEVRGDRGFLVGGFGMQIVNLSEPMSPVLAGALAWDAPPGSWISVAVSGTLAVVSHSRGTPRNRNVTVGLSLVDVGDMAQPRKLGSVDLPEGSDNVGDLGISGSLVLVAARQSGLFLFDIAEPTVPRLLGNYTPRSWSRGVVVSGNVAYLSVSMTRNASSIHVLDISDPSHPTLIREIETPGPAQRMAIMDGRLYVADNQAGLRVYDLAEPDDPTFLGQVITYQGQDPEGLIASDVAAADGLVAIWGNGGVRILRKSR